MVDNSLLQYLDDMNFNQRPHLGMRRSSIETAEFILNNNNYYDSRKHASY